MISPKDLDLITVTDDVAEAVRVIRAADAAREAAGQESGDPAPVEG